MHEIEGLLAVPSSICLESVERTFTVTHKDLLSFITESLQVSPRPPQKDKPFYQLLICTSPYGCRQLISRLGDALNAPLDPMSIAVAKSVKIQD